MLCIWTCWAFDADQTAHCAQNKTHALNNEIVVNALAGVVGVGITYIKDDEDIIPLLKVWHLQQLDSNAASLPCQYRSSCTR